MEVRMKIAMLLRVFESGKTIHIELPHKRGHVIVFEVGGEYVLYKSSSVVYLKACALRVPGNDRKNFFVLDYAKKYRKDFNHFTYKGRNFLHSPLFY